MIVNLTSHTNGVPKDLRDTSSNKFIPELCQEYDYFMGNKYTPDENRAVTCIPLE